MQSYGQLQCLSYLLAPGCAVCSTVDLSRSFQATWHRFTPPTPTPPPWPSPFPSWKSGRCVLGVKTVFVSAELSQRGCLCRRCVWQRASVLICLSGAKKKKRWEGRKEGRGGGGDDRCPCEDWARSWHLWPLFQLGLLQPWGGWVGGGCKKKGEGSQMAQICPLIQTEWWSGERPRDRGEN